MEILTDEKIIELLKILPIATIIGGIILILIGVLAIILQTTSSKIKNFKNVVLPSICFFIIFCGLGGTMIFVSIATKESSKEFSVSYGIIESTNWEYDDATDHDSYEKKYYARVEGLNGKATLSEEEYNSLEKGDKVIIVYQKDRLRLVFDLEEYEYNGKHWVD